MSDAAHVSVYEFADLVDRLNSRIIECRAYNNSTKCQELALLQDLLRLNVVSLAAPVSVRETNVKYDFRHIDNFIESNDVSHPVYHERQKSQYDKKLRLIKNIDRIIRSVPFTSEFFETLQQCIMTLRTLQNRVFGHDAIDQLNLNSTIITVTKRLRDTVLANYYSPLELQLLEHVFAIMTKEVGDKPKERNTTNYIWDNKQQNVFSYRLLGYVQGKFICKTDPVTVYKKIQGIVSNHDIPYLNKINEIESFIASRDITESQDGSTMTGKPPTPHVVLQATLDRMQQTAAKATLAKDFDVERFQRNPHNIYGLRLLKLLRLLHDVDQLLGRTRLDFLSLRHIADESISLGWTLHEHASFLVCNHLVTMYPSSIQELSDSVMEDLSLSMDKYLRAKFQPLTKCLEQFRAVYRLFLVYYDKNDGLNKLCNYVSDLGAALDNFGQDLKPSELKESSTMSAPPPKPQLLSALAGLLEATSVPDIMSNLKLLATQVPQHRDFMVQHSEYVEQLQRIYQLFGQWQRYQTHDLDRLYNKHKIMTIVDSRIIAGRDMPLEYLNVLRHLVKCLEASPENRLFHSQLCGGRVISIYPAEDIMILGAFLDKFLVTLKRCHEPQPAPKPETKETIQKAQANKDIMTSKEKPVEHEPPPQTTESKESTESKDKPKEPSEAIEGDKSKEGDKEGDKSKEEEQIHQLTAEEIEKVSGEAYLDHERTATLLLSLLFFCDNKWQLSKAPHILNVALPQVVTAIKSANLHDSDRRIHPMSRSLTKHIEIVTNFCQSAAQANLLYCQQLHQTWTQTHQLVLDLICPDSAFVLDIVSIPRWPVTVKNSLVLAAQIQWRQLLLDVVSRPHSAGYLDCLRRIPWRSQETLAPTLVILCVLLPMVDSGGPLSVWAANLVVRLLKLVHPNHNPTKVKDNEKSRESQTHDDDPSRAMIRQFALAVVDQVVDSTKLKGYHDVWELTTPALEHARSSELVMVLAEQDPAALVMMLVLDDARNVGVTKGPSTASMFSIESTNQNVCAGWAVVPLVYACCAAPEARDRVVQYLNQCFVSCNFPPVYSQNLRVTNPVVVAMFSALKQFRGRLGAVFCYLDWVIESANANQWHLQNTGLNWELADRAKMAVWQLYKMYCCISRLSCKLFNFCGHSACSFRVFMRASFMTQLIRQEYEADFVAD